MEFKDKVKMLRARLLITQEQLANELGCALSTVNRWEKGRIPPSFILEEKFKKLCSEKGITFNES